MEMAPYHLTDLDTLLLSTRTQCTSSAVGMVMTQWMTSSSFHLVSIFYFAYIVYLASKYWYEIRKVRGIKPPPRYRHTAIMCNQSMIVFGGVDTN